MTDARLVIAFFVGAVVVVVVTVTVEWLLRDERPAPVAPPIPFQDPHGRALQVAAVDAYRMEGYSVSIDIGQMTDAEWDALEEVPDDFAFSDRIVRVDKREGDRS